ncbi:helix-turn-helix domain-containing protein [Actinomadura montaniterrae]|uniref:Helix-turn-helix domain-containing protein n=1 Tax=Actinomadura montaniterrae TaxID=1803903 RepID=A0A6L3VZF3_9ACTN|nr:helix-turn-helix transcriptional regulator [Actinomadura montaniterrae]KAB2381363.1 helix-turn-helix domain-containing protein [Actinomadura montaniterrae]
MAENQARIFFGEELRRMREKAGLTGKELADALGCTPQWISTMESGRKVSEQSALDLDTYFKTDDHFHLLWRLANSLETKVALLPGFTEYLERERKAATARTFSALLVNGRFQSEEYARAVLSSTRSGDVEGLVENRLARGTTFLRDPLPSTWLTLDETVLYRRIGGARVMKSQLNYLLELSEHPEIVINIIPQDVGYHAGLGGEFTILSFNGSQAAYTESAGVGILIEDPVKVESFALRWDLLRSHALPVNESRVLIRNALESL